MSLNCSSYSLGNTNYCNSASSQVRKLVNLYTRIKHYHRSKAASSTVIQTMVLHKAFIKSWLYVGTHHGSTSLPKGALLPQDTAASPTTSSSKQQHTHPLGVHPVPLIPGPTGKEMWSSWICSWFHCQIPTLSMEAQQVVLPPPPPLLYSDWLWNTSGSQGMKQSGSHVVEARTRSSHTTIPISATNISGLFLSQVLQNLTFFQMQQKNKILLASARKLADMVSKTNPQRPESLGPQQSLALSLEIQEEN